MKLNAMRAAMAVFLVLIPAVGQAQEFSADVIYTAAKSPASTGKVSPPPQASKLYVSKDKMRLETRGVSGTVLLVDFADNTTTALFPEHKTYEPLLNAPSQYFRVTDAENACPAWQKASNQKIVCEKVGHEKVDGRDAVKYQNRSAVAEPTTTAIWVDPALHFVIKWEGADTGAELHNVNEGTQAADLFVVPPSYEILKPKKKAPKSPR